MNKQKIIKYGKTAGFIAEVVPMVALKVVKTERAKVVWSAVGLAGAVTYLTFTIVECVNDLKENKS